MNMDFLNDILCTYPILPWLLPFILGLAVGWTIWGRYSASFAGLRGENATLKTKIHDLEGDLKKCKAHSASLESDLALIKGKLREAEAKIGSVHNEIKTEETKPDLSFITSDETGAEEANQVSKPTLPVQNISTHLSSHNLQIIEGIGPKMEEVLKSNGVENWSDLARQTPESLLLMLSQYGESYRIIDPSSWPDQAKLAINEDFESLILYQKNLEPGQEGLGQVHDSKLEKILISSGLLVTFQENDLKAIEGIGPKIEKLLHDAGITTWATLAETSTERINDILNAAGNNYHLADPASWPQQAALLADGKFQEFEEYKEFLNQGKQPESE